MKPTPPNTPNPRASLDFLPKCWSDMESNKMILVFSLALLVVDGSLSIEQFRLKCLKIYVSDEMISYYFKIYRADYRRQWWRSLLNFIRYQKWDRPVKLAMDEQVEELTSCLVIKSNAFNWVFKLQDGVHVLNCDFRSNPVPRLFCLNGVIFNINKIVETTITAKQFSDCYEIASAYASSKDEKFLDLLILEMYAFGLSEHRRACFMIGISKLEISVKICIYSYFNSIILFIYNHPDYSLLFSDNEKYDNTLKISGESIFRLSEAGYGSVHDIESMNLLRFFDLQLADLKCNIQRSIGLGRKAEEIARSTGISMRVINKLI